MKKLLIKIIVLIAIILINLSIFTACDFKSVNDHYDINLEGDFEVSFLISCNTILTTDGAFDNLSESLQPLIPKDGLMFAKTTVLCETYDSVLDMLKKICANQKLQLTAGSDNYVSSIGHLTERLYFNNLGGWMYKVNGKLADYGAADYTLKVGDNVEWHYTCEPNDI